MSVQQGLKEEGHWENGYCESFNGTMRHELLNVETFFSLKEARSRMER